MRIAYFQMDKHSSIALQDLHIFPTKNQIIVTLLFGPNFVILDLADLFLSFQLLLPTSGGPVSHKPVTLVPSRSIPRSRLPQLDAIQGAHIFKGAEELGLGSNQLPNLSKIVSHGRIFFVLPVGGEKKQNEPT